MGALNIILLILLFASGIGLIITILLHSGKGTGLSDMLMSSMYSSQNGTGIVEKNIDRITIILAIVFLVTLILMMILWPAGSIGA